MDRCVRRNPGATEAWREGIKDEGEPTEKDLA
jgi:hypothetical protein